MKPKKKPMLIAFSIVVATLFVCYAALLVFLPVIVVGNMSAIGPFFTGLFQNLVEALAFKYGFEFNPATGLISYLLYFVILVFVALMVVTIVVSIKKGKGSFGWYSIVLFIATLTASFILPDFVVGGIGDMLKLVANVGYKIYIIAYYVIGVLFYVFAIVLMILGLTSIGKETISEEKNNDLPYSFVSQDAMKEDEIKTEEVAPTPEPVPLFTPEPEPAPEEKVEPTAVEEVPAHDEPLTKDSLMSMLKDVVKDLVRDEISKMNENKKPETTNSSVIGATFGAPLIVQNFYGVTPSQEPKPEVKEEPKVIEKIVEKPVPVEVVKVVEVEKPVEKKEEVKPEPVEETKVVEPVAEPDPAPAPEVKVETVEPTPAPIEEAAPAEKPKIIRIPFEERMINAEQEMKDNYNALKNEILSYGVKSRVSNSGDTFRLHRVTFVKITIAGKSLKLYFALNPEDYKESTVPVQDAGEKNIYSDIPLVFKVKSPLSLKRAKQLIQDVMEKHELEQGEVLNTDWVKDIEENMKK